MFHSNPRIFGKPYFIPDDLLLTSHVSKQCKDIWQSNFDKPYFIAMKGIWQSELHSKRSNFDKPCFIAMQGYMAI